MQEAAFLGRWDEFNDRHRHAHPLRWLSLEIIATLLLCATIATTAPLWTNDGATAVVRACTVGYAIGFPLFLTARAVLEHRRRTTGRER